MKRIVVPLVLVASAFAFAKERHLVMEFQEVVDIHVVLAGYTVLNAEQLGNEPTYRVTLDAKKGYNGLINELASLPGLVYLERDQQGMLLTTEGSASIDQRTINILDDFGGGIDQRTINILDEIDEVVFAPLYSQSFVQSVSVIESWPYATGAGVIVAILDTGIDADHEFLVNNVVPWGYDFVDQDDDPFDERADIDSNQNGVVDEGWGHGTHVAGIVKAIAPRVSILPIRVVDSDGQAELFDIVEGIEYAIRNGADVINLSMSIDEPSNLLLAWLDLCKMLNILVVTSAGNQNSNSVKFPATENEVMTVTSLDQGMHKSTFANYSNKVDISAPGEEIISCLPGNAYVSRSGTSMAAPIVAGQAAIILELVPGANLNYVRGRIMNHCVDINAFNPQYHNKLGKGLADVWDSITLNY